MGEVTMLSKMVAAGLVCTFQCNGSVFRDLVLTVRMAGRFKDHVYSCDHALGTSKLIALAWRDWQSYVEDVTIPV
jgi:hypothetical protein